MNRRLTALIVGISNYPNGAKLNNPSNDAADITSALKTLGFSIIEKIDCTSEELERAVDSFKDNLNSNDVGLFYFAGHGMQIKGVNYLNCIDTSFVDEISAKHSSFVLNQIIDVMDSCSNKTNLIVLDACRNNPFVRAWNRGPEQHGLASVYTPRGTLIAFATSPGEVAADGTGRNGSYTEALLRHINTHDIPVEDLFKRVRNTLGMSTSGKQTSWEHTSLSGDFYFNMSVGRSISTYTPEAISDSQYVLKPIGPVKEAIRALKSNNWYSQNPGLTSLTDADINACDESGLFVLGRNIYQAACGGANAAVAYIRDYHNGSADYDVNKAKAILDGLIFEIFFNSKGEIRKDFKISMFNDVFELNKSLSFSESFDFISEVLLNYQNRFYVIPGKKRPVNIDVSAVQNSAGEYVIDKVLFEGFDIRRPIDVGPVGSLPAYPIKFDRLISVISNEMVIPISQLSVSSNFDQAAAKILFPSGYTLRK